jgi:hypothetical protein
MHLRCKQIPAGLVVNDWLSVSCGVCELHTIPAKTMSFPVRPKGSLLFA